MKEIKLNGKHSEGRLVMVDDDDFEWLSNFKWFTKRRTTNGILECWCRPPGTRQTKDVVMHRLIMGVTDPRFYVDHIDHNPLNNQRSNLRITSCKENAMNRSKSTTRGKTSKYKGVFKKWGAWASSIGLDGKQIYLGTYTTELAAAKVYNDAALLYHKEFACLNDLPDEVIVVERLTKKGSRQRAVRPNMGSSKYKGVHWHEKANKWQATLGWKGVVYYLGLHKNEADAANAYNKKAIEIHGDKAVLNCIFSK